MNQTSPVILTNSQFNSVDKPVPPKNVTYEMCVVSPTVTKSLLSKASEREVSLFMARQDFAIDDAKSTLSELKDVLKVQGITVTDTLVDTRKKKRFVIF